VDRITEELMSAERPPVTNIIFGTMTLGYRGYGSRVHDTATGDAMLTMYSDAGYRALDTAHVYGGGSPPDTTRRARTTPRCGTSSKPPSG
jgi:aflatoxin B1 aldehyde reductase